MVTDQNEGAGVGFRVPPGSARRGPAIPRPAISDGVPGALAPSIAACNAVAVAFGRARHVAPLGSASGTTHRSGEAA
jgi:hypothetical protein